MDIHEAKTLIEENDVYVLDIRDPDSFAQGHIPHAIHLTDQNIPEFCANSDKERPVICCCYHGNSSRMAALFLQEQGFKTVYSMDGGMEAWKETYPVEVSP